MSESIVCDNAAAVARRAAEVFVATVASAHASRRVAVAVSMSVRLGPDEGLGDVPD